MVDFKKALRDRRRSKGNGQMDLLEDQVNMKLARIDEKGHAHSPLPPSAWHRWMNCAPSMAYVDALVKAKIIKARVSGDAAQRGTRIHAWGEQFIRWMRLDKKTTSVKGDATELAEAREYAEYCIHRLNGSYLLDPSPRCGIEDRAIVDRDYCWGSRDFWVFACGRLTVIDLKSGREPVAIDDNYQFLIYALDKAEELGAEEVETVAWQPNSDSGGDPEKSRLYTMDEIRVHAAKIRQAIENAKAWFGEPYASMHPHLAAGDHCSWCDALGVCPSARRYNQAISKEGFMPVETDKPGRKTCGKPVAGSTCSLLKNHRGQCIRPIGRAVVPAKGGGMPVDPKLLTPEQVGQVMERMPVFLDWLDAVKVHALELMQKGDAVPGFKAVAKITRFAWRKEYTRAQIAKKLGVKETDITETKLLSPSKVKAVVGRKKIKVVEDLTFRPFAVTVARESDRRQAIPSTKISFEPVAKGTDDNDD